MRCLLIFSKEVLMRETKFNVNKDIEKRTYDGVTFDSVLEMKYYRDYVCPKEESGEIKKCEMQIPYELQPNFKHDNKTVKAITYVADFVLEYADGHTEVIDVKGCPDTTALLKRKLFWFRYPDVAYRWMSYSGVDGGWIDYDDLKKARNERKKMKNEKENNCNEEDINK